MSPVGASGYLSGLSYVAVGRETTFATYNTCTAGLQCTSANVSAIQEFKVLDQIDRYRDNSRGVRLMKKVKGDLEFHFAPQLDACTFILQNAFGGTITSATATGETVGAGASSGMTHTFNLGNMDQSYPSICVNIRKGDTTTGRVFMYNGVRVNDIQFSAEIDSPLKCSVNLGIIDATQQTNDVSAAIGVTSTALLNFTDGRISVETTFASLTSTSFWHVISCQFGWTNNLKQDNDAGRIGSAILTQLPVGMREHTLKCKIRFDTTTAFDAMMANTKLSAQLQFQGPTLTSSAIRQGVRFDYPVVYIKDAGDPQIGGPDEVLTSDVEFAVLRDDTSSTGYAVQGIVTNSKSSFA